MQDEGMNSSTLRDYVQILFRRKGVVLTAVITVVAVVLSGIMLQTPVYEAQVKLLISAQKQIQSPYYSQIIGTQNIEASVTQSEIVISGPVVERVVQALSLHLRPWDYEKKYASPLKKFLIDFQGKLRNSRKSDLSEAEEQKIAFNRTVAGLKKGIKVVPVRDTNMFIISVRDPDPRAAAAIANVASRSYIIFDLEQQLAELTLKYGEKHPSALQLQDNIDRLLHRLDADALSNIDAIGPASVKIIEQAAVPLRPAGGSRTTLLIIGILLSIFLGIFLAFSFEYMDPTFKSPKDIERELKFPILGFVLKRKRNEEKLIHSADQNDFVRSYQEICDQLCFQIKDKGLKSVLVVASGNKEGTSTLIANLGMFLAERAGYDVLLLDANFRNPSLHGIFKLNNTVGFSEAIEGKVPVASAVKAVGKKLHVMVAGKTGVNPALLLDSPKAREVIAEAVKGYQIVLVDGPNLARYRDSVGLSAYTEAVVLVVSEGKTRRQVVQATLQPLVERKSNILGVVVNNRQFFIPKFIYDRI